jgi:hypothetical protein
VPELVVELHEDYRGGEQLGAGPLITEVPASDLERWAATHRREGILVAAGPGIRPGRPPQHPRVEDVGMNALALAGAALPRDRDGRVWSESLIFSPRYLEADVPVSASGPRSQILPSGTLSAPVTPLGDRGGTQAEEIARQLRRLGYL